MSLASPEPLTLPSPQVAPQVPILSEAVGAPQLGTLPRPAALLQLPALPQPVSVAAVSRDSLRAPIVPNYAGLLRGILKQDSASDEDTAPSKRDDGDGSDSEINSDDEGGKSPPSKPLVTPLQEPLSVAVLCKSLEESRNIVGINPNPTLPTEGALAKEDNCLAAISIDQPKSGSQEHDIQPSVMESEGGSPQQMEIDEAPQLRKPRLRASRGPEDKGDAGHVLRKKKKMKSVNEVEEEGPAATKRSSKPITYIDESKITRGLEHSVLSIMRKKAAVTASAKIIQWIWQLAPPWIQHMELTVFCRVLMVVRYQRCASPSTVNPVKAVTSRSKQSPGILGMVQLFVEDMSQENLSWNATSLVSVVLAVETSLFKKV